MTHLGTFLSILDLGVLAYLAYVCNQTRKSVSSISMGKTARLNNIAKVVERNQFGEWDRVGKYVRVGSVKYKEALDTPGVALLHRNGAVEEGNQ